MMGRLTSGQAQRPRVGEHPSVRDREWLAYVEQVEERAESLLRELQDLVRQLGSPPPGWFTLGTHIDPETGKALDVALEFWGNDGGVPFWERPVRSTSEPYVGMVVATRWTASHPAAEEPDGTQVTIDMEPVNLHEGQRVYVSAEEETP